MVLRETERQSDLLKVMHPFCVNTNKPEPVSSDSSSLTYSFLCHNDLTLQRLFIFGYQLIQGQYRFYPDLTTRSALKHCTNHKEAKFLFLFPMLTFCRDSQEDNIASFALGPACVTEEE